MRATRENGRVDIPAVHPALSQVEVKGRKQPRDEQYTYDNPAYTGSVDNVNNVPRRQPQPTPPLTGVYREQYWACSRWPHTQRVLAIAVGVLLGALVGLGITMACMGDDEDSGILPGPLGPFRLQDTPVPD